jgi:hypothetical protein
VEEGFKIVPLMQNEAAGKVLSQRTGEIIKCASLQNASKAIYYCQDYLYRKGWIAWPWKTSVAHGSSETHSLLNGIYER